MKQLIIIVMMAISVTAVTGCIPTGGSSPANGFNVNISSAGLIASPDNPSHKSISKLLVIDGDSLFFTIERFGGFGYVQEWVRVYSQSLTGNAYDMAKNTQDFNAAYAAGVTINANTTVTWEPFSNYSGFYNVGQYANFDQMNDLYAITTTIIPLWEANAVRYLVFRRLKGSDFQYYWVKLTANILTAEYGGITIGNGRFQLNSIVTGQ